MSVNINIQKLDHKQTELERINKINYNFSNILRSLHGELQTIREIVGIDVHNDLTGREADNCHPVDAIAGLSDTLTRIEERFVSIESDITDMQQDIIDIEDTLEDHERRIEELERG